MNAYSVYTMVLTSFAAGSSGNTTGTMTTMPAPVTVIQVESITFNSATVSWLSSYGADTYSYVVTL